MLFSSAVQGASILVNVGDIRVDINYEGRDFITLIEEPTPTGTFVSHISDRIEVVLGDAVFVGKNGQYFFPLLSTPQGFNSSTQSVDIVESFPNGATNLLSGATIGDQLLFASLGLGGDPDTVIRFNRGDDGSMFLKDYVHNSDGLPDTTLFADDSGLAVPEPSTLFMSSLGLLSFFIRKRR